MIVETQKPETERTMREKEWIGDFVTDIAYMMFGFTIFKAFTIDIRRAEFHCKIAILIIFQIMM